jgi:hypothetical protein
MIMQYLYVYAPRKQTQVTLKFRCPNKTAICFTWNPPSLVSSPNTYKNVTIQFPAENLKEIKDIKKFTLHLCKVQ